MYIPSHTWLLQVNLTNCRVVSETIDFETGENVVRWCLKSVGLRARALPPSDPETGIVNMTEGNGHLFNEMHPFTDSYYYLLLYTEGQTDITIKISTKGNINIYFYLIYNFLFLNKLQCFIVSSDFNSGKTK